MNEKRLYIPSKNNLEIQTNEDGEVIINTRKLEINLNNLNLTLSTLIKYLDQARAREDTIYLAVVIAAWSTIPYNKYILASKLQNLEGKVIVINNKKIFISQIGQGRQHKPSEKQSVSEIDINSKLTTFIKHKKMKITQALRTAMPDKHFDVNSLYSYACTPTEIETIITNLKKYIEDKGNNIVKEISSNKTDIYYLNIGTRLQNGLDLELTNDEETLLRAILAEQNCKIKSIHNTHRKLSYKLFLLLNIDETLIKYHQGDFKPLIAYMLQAKFLSTFSV
jgi:hypothetical protein